MKIEYEATFTGLHKEDIRARLISCAATLVSPEYVQRRVVYTLPLGHEIAGGWLRVRDEGDKITMSLKVIDGAAITDQKETCLIIDSFEDACLLLESIGCQKKAFQESKRELWKVGDVEVTIDEWPFLEPFVEVEGKNEESVRAVSTRLDFDWSSAKFCSVATLYREQYGVPEDTVNNATPRIVFDMQNPFTRTDDFSG